MNDEREVTFTDEERHFVRIAALKHGSIFFKVSSEV